MNLKKIRNALRDLKDLREQCSGQESRRSVIEGTANAIAVLEEVVESLEDEEIIFKKKFKKT